MPEKDIHEEKPAIMPLFNMIPADLAGTAMKQVAQFIAKQTELFDTIQKANLQWLDRAQAETALTSEFAAKLNAARSLPDGIKVWQDWSSRRFQMMTEDAQHVMGDIQKIMQKGAGVLMNGSQPGAS